MGLFVKLGNRSESILLDTSDDKSWIEVMGIDIAKPGEYKTVCGKGYFKCGKDELATLKLKFPAIDYFKFESAHSFFVWDDKTRHFKRIWMSD